MLGTRKVLVAAIIIEIGEELKKDNLTETQIYNYRNRLEATRDYCNEVIEWLDNNEQKKHKK